MTVQRYEKQTRPARAWGKQRCRMKLIHQNLLPYVKVRRDKKPSITATMIYVVSSYASKWRSSLDSHLSVVLM